MYDATQQKHRALREGGYRLRVLWECDWDREVKTDAALQTFLASRDWVDPLQPRDAFFGGHTNAVRLHHEADAAREGKDQVPGRDVAVPVGQQDADLSRRASRDHDRSRPHRHLEVLWTGQGGHSPSLRVVPSRAALSPRGQTHLSPLCQVRGDRDVQTSPRKQPRLSSHPRPMPIARDLVHPRTRQGRGKGVHDFDDPQSLAFSRIVPSRPTRHPDGGLLGGDDGRVGRGRPHRGFLLRGPQELWVQDPARQSGMQGAWLHPQRAGLPAV